MADNVRTERAVTGAENWLYRDANNHAVLQLAGPAQTNPKYFLVRRSDGKDVVRVNNAGYVEVHGLTVRGWDATENFGLRADAIWRVLKTKAKHLPLILGGGTADIEAFNGAPSINLDADGETFYASFRAPAQWIGADDLTFVMMVANEIAEDDGDDVSITCQVRGYADGETTGDAGQTVACTLNLTGGDQAINVVNRVSGTIDYDDATYPIAAGDTVVIKATVNLGGEGECTGPLHVIGMWVEYNAEQFGE